MRIPFGNPVINANARERIKGCLNRNWASAGQNVKDFERGWAELFGYGHAVATSSGTDAGIVSVATLYERGAQRDDEVICPALCFVACGNSILAAGFRPAFVDVELETLNIDPAKIEERITDRTRAILAVHTMGKPCDMDSILKIAKKHDLTVIEDSCEAHGAKYKDRFVGTIGDMGTFSFYAAHIVFAAEGGMVVTDSDELADLCRSIRSHGRPPGSAYFDFVRFGTNSKMNDLEGAVGAGSLLDFEQTISRRKGHQRRLLEASQDLTDRVHLLREEEHEFISPHAFPLVLKDPKDDLQALYAHLEGKGIQCKTLFGCLPTQHRAFAWMGHQKGEFPVSEYIGENGLHFGLHENLEDEDVEFVSEMLHGYFAAR